MQNEGTSSQKCVFFPKKWNIFQKSGIYSILYFKINSHFEQFGKVEMGVGLWAADRHVDLREPLGRQGTWVQHGCGPLVGEYKMSGQAEQVENSGTVHVLSRAS